MLCEICNKNEATVHYTEIISNKMSEMHLCEDCAREKGTMIEPHFPLADLLAGLADVKVPLKVGDGEIRKCSNCGLTYEDFRKVGRLGCAQCYYAFKHNLSSLLKRVHGSTVHVGKVPASAGKVTKTVSSDRSVAGTTLEDLRNKLQLAIQKEEFEEAARVRDQIREMEKE